MSDSEHPWLALPPARPTTGPGVNPVAFTVGALVLLVLVHAYALRGDLAAEEEQAAALAARDAAEAARKDAALRREFAPRIAAAYAQGQRDAMATLQGRPQGVALAQACLALRGAQP